MRKEYFKRVLKTGGKAALLIALVAVPAYAITHTNWVHPCDDSGDLVCDGGMMCPPFCMRCRCEGSFDNDNHWSFGAPDGNLVTIRHSHADVNTGGIYRHGVHQRNG
jgi:hypothetical protein